MLISVGVGVKIENLNEKISPSSHTFLYDLDGHLLFLLESINNKNVD